MQRQRPARRQTRRISTPCGNVFAKALLRVPRREDLNTGSPRDAHALGIPSLRAWPLTRYPFLVFYVEAADHIEVWGVLHTSRDIPERMRELGED